MHWNNPWFLIGLAALAVPVIVHLFQLRRYQKVVFSNVRLLQQLVMLRARQKTLLHRLVLGLRLLALLTLVLAFAQPSFFKEQTRRTGPEAVCIYLDNSYSMSAMHQNTALFELARQLARNIVRSHAPDTRFCLITNNPFRPLFFGNATSCLTWIDETTLYPSSLTLKQIQKRFEQLLQTQSTSQKQAYLISDFRKNLSKGWTTGTNPDIQTTWLTLPVPEQHNISIDSVWLEAPFLPSDRSIRLRFSASNHSDQDLSDLGIQLKQGTAVVSSISINIPAGSTLNSGIQAQGFATSGIQNFSLSTTDEGFPFDNQLFFSIWPSSTGSTAVIGSGNRWLQAMLNSTSIFRDTGSSTGLRIYSSLLRLDAGTAQNILDQSNKGATSVLIPDEAAQPDQWNTGLRLLGFPDIQPAQQGAMFTGTPAYTHPLLRDVFVKKNEDAALGSCTQFFPTGGSLGYAENLLPFRDGNPAVLYRKTGQGGILLFTMPWTTSNSSFLNSALPLTLLINGAIRRTHPQPLYLTVGDGKYLELEGRMEEGKTWNLEFNGQKRIAEAVPFESKIRFYAGSSVHEPGIYRLLRPDGTAAGTLALNVPRTESNPERISASDLSNLAREAGATLSSDSGSNFRGASAQKPIRWLALAIALLLMAEIILLAPKRNKPAHVQP
jgi:hypothetical protein